MPQIQTAPQSGEMTQRFIEFVMMQSQHAALFLGQIPNPETGETTVNLDAARMFIDQLEMIGEKTRGNLTSEESGILTNALTNLRMVYVEISGGTPSPISQPPEPAVSPASAITSDTTIDPDSKKRFTKSYGA